MNVIDSATMERMHRAQAALINRVTAAITAPHTVPARDLSQLVHDELAYRLEINDRTVVRDFVRWMIDDLRGDPIDEWMNPGELSHKEVIDKWRMVWVEHVVKREGWQRLDTLYRLGVGE